MQLRSRPILRHALPWLAAFLCGGWQVVAQDAPASAPAPSPESAPTEAPASKPATEDAPTERGKKIEAAAAESPGAAIRFNGSLDLRYRFRSTEDGQRDQDLLSSVGLDANIPGVGKDGLTLRATGAFLLDLDDFVDAGNAFNGLAETWRTRARTYLYEAYGESHGDGLLGTLRVGRQMLWREEGIRFDGAYIETARQGPFVISTYAGVPVHLYESSARGDVLAGLGLRIHASKALTFTVDEIYVRDRRNFAGAPDRQEDLLSAFGIELRPGKHWYLRGSTSLLDARDRRQSADLGYTDPENGFRANARILRQNDYTDIPVTEFSPFVALLGNLEPYLEGRVDASKTLFSPVEIGGGYAIRRLVEGGREGFFNREFDHAYGNLNLSPFPVEEMTVSFRGDWWESDDTDFGGAGFSIEKRFGKDFRITLSSDYTLYRVDLLTGEERFRDRQYALRTRARLFGDVQLGAGYRYGVDAFNEYHVADITLTIRF